MVVRSGIGKVNAAMCAQILADVYHADHVINTGIAGSFKGRDQYWRYCAVYRCSAA